VEHLFNPRLLFALFVFVIWAFRAVKAAVDKSAAARENRPVARGPHGEPIDPEAEERQRQVQEEQRRKAQAEVARQMAQRKILTMTGAQLGAPPRVGRVAFNPPKAAPSVQPEPEPISQSELESIPDELPSAQPARSGVALYPSIGAMPPLTAAPLVLPPLVTAFSAAPVMATAARSAAWSDTARAADRERWSDTARAVARVTLEDLRDPAAVRQAVLLREILSPPVGLR